MWAKKTIKRTNRSKNQSHGIIADPDFTDAYKPELTASRSKKKKSLPCGGASTTSYFYDDDGGGHDDAVDNSSYNPSGQDSDDDYEDVEEDTHDNDRVKMVEFIYLDRKIRNFQTASEKKQRRFKAWEDQRFVSIQHFAMLYGWPDINNDRCCLCHALAMQLV